MENIDFLTSIAGRKLLQEIFRELKFVKQHSSLSVLMSMWRICTTEKELGTYVNRNISIVYPLGFLKGTALWMEETVNRFYYSSINSFVYLGAALLLVLIGMRRFNENISDELVISGIIFEAFLLFIMFVVMLFSPSEDLNLDEDKETDARKEIINELGEIGTDFAKASENLEKLVEGVTRYNQQNEELIAGIKSVSDKLEILVQPNEAVGTQIAKLAIDLENLSQNLKNLNKAVDFVQSENIKNEISKKVDLLLQGLKNE